MKFKNFDRNKLLFCNIAWMKHYQGKTKDDTPIGGGSHVKKYKDAFEDKNFKPIKKDDSTYYFGYVQPPSDPNKPLACKININNLGANKNDTSVSEVTVIWIATNPKLKRLRVVGWYKKATIFRNTQVRKNNRGYRMCALVKNSTLLSEYNRKLQPNPFRSIMYGSGKAQITNAFLKELDNLLSKTPSPVTITKQDKLGGNRRMVDVEKRQQIEQNAVDLVRTYYESNGCIMKSVEKDNVGWDLVATKGGAEWRIEVKGHSGSKINSELTPNEYDKAQSEPKYRLAIVTNALKPKPCLRIFAPKIEDKELQWDCKYPSNKPIKVTTTERIGALISEKK